AAAARGRRQGGRDAHPPGLPRAPAVTRLLAAGAVLAAAAAVVAFVLVLRAPGPPRPAPVTVTLEEGERFAEVAEDLRRQGVLRHPLPLVVWARLTRQDRAVHWGEYLITTPLSPLELLARLTGPPDPLHQLTVPAALTLRPIDQHLAASEYVAVPGYLCLLGRPHF